MKKRIQIKILLLKIIKQNENIENNLLNDNNKKEIKDINIEQKVEYIKQYVKKKKLIQRKNKIKIIIKKKLKKKMIIKILEII